MRSLLYIGLDDTDTLDSPGTGRLAREIAATLAATYPLAGVTRHQLLYDPRVPYTAKNSSAAIMLKIADAGPATLTAIREQVSQLLAGAHAPGSDPGVAVATTVPAAVRAFGRRTQVEVVSQKEARTLAATHKLYLRGLAGTEDGVIGALAAIGLASTGNDGRYILVGRSRELAGPVSVAETLAAGVTAVRTLDGRPVTAGTILVEKIRPARRNGHPILFVEAAGPYWRPLKLD